MTSRTKPPNGAKPSSTAQPPNVAKPAPSEAAKRSAAAKRSEAAKPAAAGKPSGISALRDPVFRLTEPVTRVLVRMGIHPNVVTLAGVAVTIAAAVLYSLDHVRTAGFLVLFGGLCDVFDGAVARLSGVASKFGAFFDATLARFSEIAMYIGLMSLYNRYQADTADFGAIPVGMHQVPVAVLMIYVIALAMGGSLMVSYTRAKAESLGMPCSGGFMQRGERIIFLGLGSLAFGLSWSALPLSIIIVIVAVSTNLTALHRILSVYRHVRGTRPDSGGETS